MTRRSAMLVLGFAAVRGGRAAGSAEETALRGKEKLVLHSPRPLDLETPPELLDSWITPNSRFFVRSHFYIPNAEANRWKISIEGLVEKPFSLTLEELQGMPRIERVV